MRRGEIYRVYQPPGDTKQYRAFVIVSHQGLVDSRDAAVVCAPIYSRGAGLATQVAVGPEEGLKHESWIICDNLDSIDKSQLTNYIGSLSASKIKQLDRSLALALDLPIEVA
jgi:mRNA interferase MazF